MNYSETLDYLYSRLPAYHRIGRAAYRNNLDVTLALDEYFGHPHGNYRSVHIAGTNGKGSVSHMLASILMESGHKTGLYTSPHLKDFRERIRVNGKMIPEDQVVAFVRDHRDIIESVQPSFFELTAAMALDYFSREGVDVSVIETGMGGRLDSTNIIMPLLSVITNIGHDHADLLGGSPEKIAAEKAGIIKKNIPVVIGETQPETMEVFYDTAGKSHSQIYFADRNYSCIPQEDATDQEIRHFVVERLSGEDPPAGGNPFAAWKLSTAGNPSPAGNLFAVGNPSPAGNLFASGNLFVAGKRVNVAVPLGGDYQARNIQTVFQVAECLSDLLATDEKAVVSGLRKVVSNTGFSGRWQILQKRPLVICDTGHNRKGLEYVIRQTEKVNAGRKHFVLGFAGDKD
ncbi:MAG: bifunctional folylpolyglutamate synthase/dihydrofolate synthase, partial [Bacteroidales bacterium]|nr:bifunctional folylpolyglutamate synthase/dihydrofolate synthase [Bacteroidales bacterium]